MSVEWDWPGARWWRLDFHTHTPASRDYLNGNEGLKGQVSPETWLLAFMRAGIDCVAVTDHNSGAWVDPLKGAYARMLSEPPPGFRPIHLFPGVEITVNGGIHLLAIFGRKKTAADIDSLLGAVGFSGTKGDSDDCTARSLIDVIDAVVKAGAIPIPAHADGPKGLLQLQDSSTTQARIDTHTIRQALKSPRVFAMEVCDPDTPKPPIYADSGVAWTEVLGSDSHNLRQDSEPGSAFTWVKMGQPSLEGLRLALLDGSLSIRRSDGEAGDPNDHGHLTIEALRIEGARYLGRPDRFECRFNPWLNAIIGGRGTGKSTLLEFLRLTMRREHEIPDRLKADFQKYGQISSSRQDEGLLLDQSKLSVTYRKDGVCFAAQWSPAGDPGPMLELGPDGQWGPTPGEIIQRLPVRIYSQKQIFELAKQPSALLQVIDHAPDVRYREWKERWDEFTTRFFALRAKMREIAAGLAERSRIDGELTDVKRKLGVFEQAGHAEILKAYQKAQRQLRMIEQWEEEWKSSGQEIRELAAQLVPPDMDTQFFNPDDRQDTAALTAIDEFTSRIKALLERLNAVAQDADGLAGEWQAAKAGADWHKALRDTGARYEVLKAELSEAGAGDPSEYGRLVQQRQGLEERLKTLDARKRTLKQHGTEADDCLEQIIQHRRALTTRRREFLRAVLAGNPYVRIDIEPYGDRPSVEGRVRELINRTQGGFEKDLGSVDGAEGLLAGLYQGDEPDEPGDFEARLVEFKRKILAVRDGNALDTVRDRRFASHIQQLPSENFDRLACWFPEDSLAVLYSDGRGGAFRPIAQGSPGQKTAALLAFLLSYGEEPLLLDQPEDDLDNHLIYDLIVTQLRRIKLKRQVIVVTHNANIVVNGDAELVTALERQKRTDPRRGPGEFAGGGDP